MPKKRFGYFILLAILAFVYIISNSHPALLLLLFCLAAPFPSFLLLLYTAPRVSLDLNVAPAIMPKDEKCINYLAKNSSLFPAVKLEWEVALKTQLTGRNTFLKLETFVGGRSTKMLPLTPIGLHAGKFTFSTHSVRVYDLFGLCYRHLEPPQERIALVYPRLAECNFKMSSRIESEEGNIYSPHKPGSDPTEILALHEYVRGDDIRKIHWKLSAKTGDLVVRDFGLPLDYPIVLLLEMQYVENKTEERSLACSLEVFISLSLSLLQLGISHNIAWYDEEYFYTEQISTVEELDTFIPVLLALNSSEKPFLALDCYANSIFAGRRLVIYYVTANRDTGPIAEILPGEAVKTILVTAAGDCTAADSSAGDGELVLVNVDSFGKLSISV